MSVDPKDVLGKDKEKLTIEYQKLNSVLFSRVIGFFDD